MEVGGEAIRPQNRSNPGVGERKARSAFVGQVGNLRPRPGGTRNRPQAASLPHITARRIRRVVVHHTSESTSMSRD